MLPLERKSRTSLDAAVDEVRERFGTAALTRGVLLGRRAGVHGAASARLSTRVPVALKLA